MKTASMPSLRVAPQLREAAEAVLHEGETLSAFMEQSLRDAVAQHIQELGTPDTSHSECTTIVCKKCVLRCWHKGDVFLRTSAVP